MNERIAARTIVLNEKNEILLLKFELPNEIFWLTPGGKIENDETPFLTAQRELYEETGIINADFITPHSYYFESQGAMRGIPTIFKEYIFIARIKNEPLNKTYQEEEEKKIIVDMKWWNIDDFTTSGEILRPHALLTTIASLRIGNQI